MGSADFSLKAPVVGSGFSLQEWTGRGVLDIEAIRRLHSMPPSLFLSLLHFRMQEPVSMEDAERRL